MSEPVRPTGRWRGILADAVLLLFVAGLGLKAAYGAGSCRGDLDCADEFILYMLPAHVSSVYKPSGEFAPLYVSWYALLMRTGLPRDEVLALNWGLLTVLVPVSAYVLARALGASRAAALVAGGGLLATKVIDVWPYPAHFVTVILALGGAASALAARRGHVPWATALAGLTLLTATYARPEFLYSVGLFVPFAVLGAVWALCRRPEARRSVPAAAAAFAVGAALLVWALGSPLSDGKRLPSAVVEHYAINLRLSGSDRREAPHWTLLWRNEFGGAESLGGLWRNNPGALAWHVGANARRLPVALVETADPWVDLGPLRCVHAYPFFPGRLPQRHVVVVVIVRAAVLCAVALGLFGAGRALRSGHRGVLVGAGLFALVTAPVLAASLVVYPRYHYLVPTVVFATALAAAGARHVTPSERWYGALRRLPVPALAAALAIAVPNRSDGWCVQKLLPGPGGGPVVAQLPTPHRDMVRILRAINSQERSAVLTANPAVPFYAGFESLDPAVAPGVGFLSCVRSTGARLVLIDPFLPGVVPGWGADPDLRALVEGKESELFRLIPVRGAPGHYVAVRRDGL